MQGMHPTGRHNGGASLLRMAAVAPEDDSSSEAMVVRFDITVMSSLDADSTSLHRRASNPDCLRAVGPFYCNHLALRSRSLPTS